MEHLLSAVAFAAVIAAQFFGVVFAAAMRGDRIEFRSFAQRGGMS